MSPFNIRSVFESECGTLKFDKKLASKINAFAVGFVNKNEEHLTFFGGHTTGVQVVRFTQADKDNWFELLGINDWALEEKLLDLPTINKEFIVSSDVFNHTCMWLIHKFLTTDLLNQTDKIAAAVDCAMVLHYRFLTSLLSYYFKFPADKEEAEAAYAMLSNKFYLKQFGSWNATLRNRCEDLVNEHNIHYYTLIDYKDDGRIVYLINDTQGRLRDMFKNIYAVIIKVNNLGIKVAKTSSVIEHDGEMILQDRTKSLNTHTRYLNSIIGDRNSFIKEELLNVIKSIMETMPPKLLLQSLEWCSKNHQSAGAPEITRLINLTLIHSFAYITNNRTIVSHTTDLSGFISRLRGVYMSSRSTDPELLTLRDIAHDIVKKSTTTRNDSVIASVRTGLLLYIVLRAFTMNYYSNNS